MSGPLSGLRVIELAGLGPAPFCGMILADLGAEVTRVDRMRRPGAVGGQDKDFLGRGRRSIMVDLKHPKGPEVVRELAASADVLLEGFRPGVMERLGLGPEALLAAVPALVYGRMTGWGQSGPLAPAAGHDINYIAVAGALEPVGRAGGPPVPPLALVGDFGGGGMLLAMGVCAALVERSVSGQGQVIDAASVDGASLLMTVVHSFRADGAWSDARGTNLFDSGAPFYDAYQAADGTFVSVGAIEPQFYDALVDVLGLDRDQMYPQHDRARWPARKELIASVFKTRTRAEWAELMAGRDACFAPVLAPGEAPAHPHNRERGSFVDVGGDLQPAPAPRFSRTPAAVPSRSPWPGQHTDAVLRSAGIPAHRVESLRQAGVVA
ncbi:MAG TPA: CaiB/BaiF CoA-transferase family protein [Trebonia sp.]